MVIFKKTKKNKQKYNKNKKTHINLKKMRGGAYEVPVRYAVPAYA
jgi:hypothetical protein